MSLKEYKNLLEDKFKEIQAAEWVDSPFPMDDYEAFIWQRSRLELMQWVLEMLPSEETESVF